MHKNLNKPLQKIFLLGLAVAFLVVLAVLFWRSRGPQLSVADEKVSPSKEEIVVEQTKDVLRSSLAGRWYPADAEALRKQLDGCFKKTDVKAIPNVVALILPHAGYQWSGQTAAMGLKATAKKYKRIVVMGPSHRTYMEEMFSVPRAGHFETPLGQIPLDTQFIDKLLKFPLFQNLPHALRFENSVEMELPLLQYCQQDFRLVLIIAGHCSLQTITKAGEVLRGLVDSDTLVVASSDFVHYGHGHRYVPFTENVPERIKQLDMGAYEYIAKLDSGGFLEYKDRTGATICGAVPVAVLLSMLDKPTKATLVKYATSGDLTGDFSNSVSYLSVAFSGEWQNRPQIEPQSGGTELTQEDKRQLLALARKAILYALQKQQVPRVADLDVTISDAISRPRAAFVTLNKNVVLPEDDQAGPREVSRLRGCIGDILPQRPLYRSVLINAINAAFRDKRFLPLTTEELDHITIEISALTTPQPVASPDQIRIGIDGVVLNKNGRSAVYLPQVAPEQGWDLNQMLTNLSLKAKLDGDAWKQGAAFSVFQAVVFGEER